MYKKAQSRVVDVVSDPAKNRSKITRRMFPTEKTKRHLSFIQFFSFLFYLAKTYPRCQKELYLESSNAKQPRSTSFKSQLYISIYADTY